MNKLYANSAVNERLKNVLDEINMGNNIVPKDNAHISAPF